MGEEFLSKRDVHLFGPGPKRILSLDGGGVRGTAAVAFLERLEEQMIPANFGVVATTNGRVRGYGNAVVGLRNPIAPPLRIVQDKVEGSASSEFELSPLFEGPPGKVHGGVAALVLDQVFGEAAAAGGSPGMTGTLTLRYRKPTALGKASAKAWVDQRNGIKTVVKGWLKDADGEVTVEAEGLFILPRWARVRGGTRAHGDRERRTACARLSGLFAAAGRP